jgi:hypothetical protein
MGERGGSKVARRPRTPLVTIRSKLGIIPASINGSIAFQSAASQPINSTLRLLIRPGSGEVRSLALLARFARQASKPR